MYSVSSCPEVLMQTLSLSCGKRERKRKARETSIMKEL
jgi:hypothetical protein